MSEDVKISLVRMGLVTGVLASVTAVFGAFIVLPYRMDAADKERAALKFDLVALQRDRVLDRELLVRIDQRLEGIEKSLPSALLRARE
jgi:hypothetical protein